MQGGKPSRSQTAITILGVTVALCVPTLASQPAQAQLFGWLGYGYGAMEPDEPMPPGAIARHLMRQGYQITRPLRRNGAVLLADVSDPRGQVMRLVVSPSDGRILERFVLAPPPRTAFAYPERPTPIERYAPPSPQAAMPEHEPSPRRPATRSSVARAPLPDARAPRAAPTEQPTQTAVNPTASVPSSAPAATPREPVPVRASPARAASAPQRTDGPGFANGVPINPLD